MKKEYRGELEKMRHSTAHVLAYAVKRLYPQTKIAIGPVIEHGFYYDFDFETPISEKDLSQIEKEMQELKKAGFEFKQEWISIDQARKLFKDEPYKLEIIREIEQGKREDFGKKQEVSIYWSGEFIDLCKGPHVQSSKEIGEFKLLNVAGAYWQGSEKNKMLTRIYGAVFPTKAELTKYLRLLEEAEKRDHRKLNKQLSLYLLSDEVGQGLVLWKPRGATIRREIEKFIITEQIKRGYQHVYSPHIGKKQLWVTSGHWDLYRDKMYAPMKIDDVLYMAKPMNCPMHMMLYKSERYSYKDLPLRIAEIASVYRYEQAGELLGLARTRYITQDDAHIFCTQEQVAQEFINVMDYAFFFLKSFGIKNYYLQLSIRDPKNKDKYLGTDEVWQNAEDQIKKAVHRKKVKFTVKEGEAAFYGPKLDFMIKDALGREWQCGTIQIDFMLPERFQLEYIDNQGQVQRPVVIHRAIAGSLERFFTVLIEHYAGVFPIWLTPVQVAILTLSDKQLQYAQQVFAVLKNADIRTELNAENKTIGYKIRESTLQKIPYMVIIGDKEVESYKVHKVHQVAIRTREGKDLGLLSINEFSKILKDQIEKRV